jgi:proteasome lid subunit RPN8/RPN11
VKWNEGLLADSLAASKAPICFAKKEVVAMPPVKNSVDSAKNGFLRKRFLNPHPAAMAPTASHKAKDVGMIGLHSPPGGRIIPSSVEGNGFSQS